MGGESRVDSWGLCSPLPLWERVAPHEVRRRVRGLSPQVQNSVVIEPLIRRFAPPSPTRGEGKRHPYCVFATLGGAAVVTKLVASRIAGPNGVGMVMRNGTRTRVPAIGTKAISI